MDTKILVVGMVAATAISASLGIAYAQKSGTAPFFKKSVSATVRTPITQSDRDLLVSAYQEERMAHDVYAAANAAFPSQTFENVMASEAKHAESVKRLLDAYGIPVPEGYGPFETLFSELSARAGKSERDAYEVGVIIETTDIRDLIDSIAETSNSEIRNVFSRIGWGSFNHLRAFVRQSEARGHSVETPYSEFLSEAEIDSTGSLSHKMSELLGAEGIETGASGWFGQKKKSGGWRGQSAGKGRNGFR